MFLGGRYCKCNDTAPNMIIGNKITRFSSLASTNDYAKLVLSTLQEGTVIIADRQIAGKGRCHRYWFSPHGGLWFSVILKPKNQSITSLLIGVVLCDVLKTLAVEPRIKWPNDILINSKKVAGVLIEIVQDTVIVGIGLNVNVVVFPGSLDAKATSLLLETGRKFDKEKILHCIIREIEKRYTMIEENGTKILLNDWCRYSDTIGRYVTVQMPQCTVEGKALSINEDGALVVKTADGSVQTIIAGDCTVWNGAEHIQR
jgi:BirA family biotin operon repressor/biotin-[acetyl-CoA-carboxylase] ligase